MAEYIQEIAAEPANKHAASNDAAHYSLPVYEWFGSDAEYSFPGMFVPDLGDDLGYVWNKQNVNDNFVTRANQLWSTPNQSDASLNGFYISSPVTASQLKMNIRVDGGIGHWMPAPIFRTLSYYWKNYTAKNANWYVKTPGLVLRNWRTNEEKIWTAGWSQSAFVSTSGQLIRLTGENKAQQVNALGPDWFIYGAMFHVVSNSTSSAQSVSAELKDYRLGWHNPVTGPGATKLIIPDKMSWDDFRAMKQRNEASFYERPQVTGKDIVLEWDYIGVVSPPAEADLCEPGEEGKCVRYTYSAGEQFKIQYFDKYGVDIKPVLQNNDLWFKFDGIDKTFYRPKAYPYGAAGSCSYVLTTGNDLSDGKLTAGGVLRAYLQNPDA